MTRWDEPLLALWRLKLRGRVRALLRRSRTLGGAISLLAGVLLLALWVASIVLRSAALQRTAELPTIAVTQLALLGYVVFIAFNATSLRGVYLPRPELERLFAAPLTLSSIVRYRMLVSIGQAVPFAGLMSLFLAPRLASFGVAFAALLVFVPAGALFGQGLSLVFARSGGALDRVLSRVPMGLMRVLGGVGLAGLLVALAFGPGLETEESRARGERERVLRDFVQERGPDAGVGGGSTELPYSVGFGSLGERVESVANHPVALVVSSPLRPWAEAITAPNLAAAAPWLALSLVLLLVMYESVARMPVDFRETSLRVAIEVERRLARVRQGQGGVGAFGTSGRTRGWRVPWIFGRTGFGAIVWLRTAMLVRQARGTLFVILAVAAIGVVLGTRVFDEPGSGTAIIAVLGVVYLGSGMRVDFRADLDRMDAIKAWPLSARSIFVASVLPGVLLTSCVVLLVLLARAGILGQFTSDLTWYAAGTPAVAYVWLAVDNAVFLLFPVRITPGQGSAIQHMGRGFLLVLLRGMLLMGSLVVAGGGAFLIHHTIMESDPTGDALATGLALAWTAVVAVLLLLLVTAFGGWALGRFDVSRIPAGTA